MKVDVPKMLALLGVDTRAAREVRGEVWLPCPLPGHPESKASWSIRNEVASDKHGHWHCFGCKRSGGPVSLVSELIGTTEQSAARWLRENGIVLADQSHVDAPSIVRYELGGERASELELPPGVVVGQPFREWPGIVRRYLVERGIGAWQVERHELGYAVGGEQVGRVVFPARDMCGRLLYYTGRTFSRERLRYRSCDGQPGARPEAALFGEARWAFRPIDVVYTVEGAINALAVERALCPLGSGSGGPAVAAFCGSSVHEEQVAKLRRFGRVVHVADGDDSGTGEEFALELHGKMGGSLDVVLAFPPRGMDAAKMARSDLRAMLEASCPAS